MKVGAGEEPKVVDPQSRLGASIREEAALLEPFGLRDRVVAWLSSGADEGVLAELRESEGACEVLVPVPQQLRSDQFFASAYPALVRFQSPEVRGYQQRLLHRARLARLAADHSPAVLARVARYLEGTDAEVGGRELPASIARIGCGWNLMKRWLERHMDAASGDPEDAMVPVDSIVEALESVGISGDGVVDVLVGGGESAPSRRLQKTLCQMPGVARLLVDRSRQVALHLETDDASDLELILEVLADLSMDPGPWIERILTLACDRRVGLRTAAEPLVRGSWPAGEPRCRELAVEGRVEQRLRALVLLRELGDAAAREFARSRGAEDRSPRVREAVSTWGAAVESPAAVPPREVVPLTARQRDQLRDLDAVRVASKNNFRTLFPKPSGVRLVAGVGLTSEAFEALVASLEDPEPWAVRPMPGLLGINRWARSGLLAAVESVAVSEDWSLDQLVRLLMQCAAERHTFIESDEDRYWPSELLEVRLLASVRGRRRATWTLLDLRDALVHAGVESGEMFAEMVRRPEYFKAYLEFGEDAVLPLLEDGVERLTDWLDPDVRVDALRPVQERRRVAGCLAAVGLLHVRPERLERVLWKRALGVWESGRRTIWQWLEGAEDWTDRLRQALTDRRAVVRRIAAEWITESRASLCVTELEAAFRAERSAKVRAAMRSALRTLGAGVADEVDVAAVYSEVLAERDRLPKSAEWLAKVEWPEVRAAGDGAVIDPDLVAGFVVRAARGKGVMPDAELRAFVGGLDLESAAALGVAVLRSWIAEDLRLPESVPDWMQDEHARLLLFGRETASKEPKGGEDLESGFEAHVANEARRYLATPHRSALRAVGVLAVPAAIGGPDLVVLVADYCREWQRSRGRQCKLLRAMLCCGSDPAVELGLGDRLVATAGFDRQGSMDLGFPSRDRVPGGCDSPGFTAQLDEDLSVRVQDPNGRVFRSIPASPAGGDESGRREAMRRLATCRRIVRHALREETQRLRSILESDVSWTAAGWTNHRGTHPVLRRIDRRVVWVAETDEGSVGFRPFGDGTLTTLDDEELSLPERARVRVATRALLGDEAASAWRDHFVAYELAFLFDQLV